MTADSSIERETLRLAREKLTAQIGDHPEISMIDIGLDPASPGQPDMPVIRVHVRREWTPQKISIPAQVDGIRVIVLSGDYRLD